MGRYSIDEFIEATGQRDLAEGAFELERDRLLELNLDILTGGSGQRKDQW
jgi:hypothetical protein